jgi:hypothetical protein
MKRILLFVIGLVISYPIFYYLAYNGNFIFKILFGIIGLGSWQILLGFITNKFKDSTFQSVISQLVFVVSIALTVVTYETFHDLTFGTHNEQEKQLANSNCVAKGTIIDIEHYSETTIRTNTIPEYWELKYAFNDSTNQVFEGLDVSKIFPSKQVGDTLSIKYLKENPKINKIFKNLGTK